MLFAISPGAYTPRSPSLAPPTTHRAGAGGQQQPCSSSPPPPPSRPTSSPHAGKPPSPHSSPSSSLRWGGSGRRPREGLGGAPRLVPFPSPPPGFSLAEHVGLVTSSLFGVELEDEGEEGREGGGVNGP